MSDFDLMIVVMLPIALAATWVVRQRRPSGFDVCIVSVIFMLNEIAIILIGQSLGATIAAGLLMLVFLPWAFVAVPKGIIGGYDIWAAMSAISMTDTSHCLRSEQTQDDPEKSDVSAG